MWEGLRSTGDERDCEGPLGSASLFMTFDAHVNFIYFISYIFFIGRLTLNLGTLLFTILVSPLLPHDIRCAKGFLSEVIKYLTYLIGR